MNLLAQLCLRSQLSFTVNPDIWLDMAGMAFLTGKSLGILIHRI